MWLAKPGCPCLTRDDHGRTALHWAAASGLCETAEALVAAVEAERRAPATGDANGGGAAPATAPILIQDVQVAHMVHADMRTRLHKCPRSF